jgi:hypothetical protein
LLPRLEDSNDLSPEQHKEFTQVGKQLSEIMSFYTTEESIFIFRLFYKQKKVVKSLRRDLNLHFKRS